MAVQGVRQKGRRARRQLMVMTRACKFRRQKNQTEACTGRFFRQKIAPMPVQALSKRCPSAVQALSKLCPSEVVSCPSYVFGIAERVGFPHFLQSKTPPECPLYNIKRDHQFESGHFS
jgi:hypothetical protein